MADTINTVN